MQLWNVSKRRVQGNDGLMDLKPSASPIHIFIDASSAAPFSNLKLEGHVMSPSPQPQNDQYNTCSVLKVTLKLYPPAHSPLRAVWWSESISNMLLACDALMSNMDTHMTQLVLREYQRVEKCILPRSNAICNAFVMLLVQFFSLTNILSPVTEPGRAGSQE